MMDPTEAPAERLRLAFELADLAERMLRQRLRRDQAELTDAEIEARVDAWYERPPAPCDGAADHAAVSWPRH
jgi:hypothetical protein